MLFSFSLFCGLIDCFVVVVYARVQLMFLFAGFVATDVSVCELLGCVLTTLILVVLIFDVLWILFGVYDCGLFNDW